MGDYHPDIAVTEPLSSAITEADRGGDITRVGLLRDVMEHYDEYALGIGRKDSKYPPIPDEHGTTYNLGISFNEYAQIVVWWHNEQVLVVQTGHVIYHLGILASRLLFASAVQRNQEEQAIQTDEFRQA